MRLRRHLLLLLLGVTALLGWGMLLHRVWMVVHHESALGWGGVYPVPRTVPPRAQMHTPLQARRRALREEEDEYDGEEPPVPRNVFQSKGNSPFPVASAPLDVFVSGEVLEKGLVFAVLGDWGGPGREPQRNVAAAMASVSTTVTASTPPLRCVLPPLKSHPSSDRGSKSKYTDDAVSQLRSRFLVPDDVVLVGRTSTRAAAFCPTKGVVCGSSEAERWYGSCSYSTGDGRQQVALAAPHDLGNVSAVASAFDFVVSTGDNMYEAGVADIRDRRFKRNFEDVYAHPALQVPWLISLGNHDHGAHGTLRDVQGQVNYSFASPRWVLPSNYYRQQVRLFGAHPPATHPALTVEFFVLDSYDVSPSLTRMTHRQLKWLRAALVASTADWRFLVGHRPLYSAGLKHGSSPALHKLLYPLMAEYNVSAYLCGDDHQLQLLREGPTRGPHIAAIYNQTDAANILYVLSGAGSRAKGDVKSAGISRTVFQSTKHGFATVSIENKRSMRISFYDQQGQRLHETQAFNRHA